MRRRALLLAGGLSIAALIAPLAAPPPPVLVWNASASAPIGLYLLRPMSRPVRGALALIRLPSPLARFAAERGYLPLAPPLIKPVAAGPGQVVCRTGLVLTLDHREVGRALAHDRRGRALPIWQGCRTLAAGEVFVMNPAVGDSFDGRYFGPVPLTALLGRARPLWTWSARIAIPSPPSSSSPGAAS